MRGSLGALRFALLSAVQNFRRNLAVSAAGVLTMGLILVLVGGITLFLHTVNSVLDQQKREVSQVSIYLQDSTSMASIQHFVDQLSADPRIKSVEFVTKDQAAARQASDPIFTNARKALNFNPLPAAINLKTYNLADLSAVNDMAKQSPIVDNSQADSASSFNDNAVNAIQTFAHVVEVIVVVLVFILAFISLVIIMNTIRTAVFIRRAEIEIMKLVGATDWFVRWPFILEGMMGGILAAVAAAAILLPAYNVGVSRVSGLSTAIFVDQPYFWFLVFALGAAGAVLGAFGSYLGIRRFLTV